MKISLNINGIILSKSKATKLIDLLNGMWSKKGKKLWWNISKLFRFRCHNFVWKFLWGDVFLGWFLRDLFELRLKFQNKEWMFRAWFESFKGLNRLTEEIKSNKERKREQGRDRIESFCKVWLRQTEIRSCSFLEKKIK